MRMTFVATWVSQASILLLAAVGIAAADQPAIGAALEAAKNRKPAPGFALQDNAGKTVKLEQYRGKVVLLNFWATWCTGCKKEMPWFAAFQQTYGSNGLNVIGVSLDENGWKAVRPFLAATPTSYSILVGNDTTAQKYGLKSLPDTFLIDRDGRIAAAYLGGMVDRENSEANIRALLKN